MTKPYELLEVRPDGTEVRLYENGAKRDQNGRLLEYMTSGNEIITPDTARSYHALRKQKILDAIESKLKDVTKTKLPSEAIAAIVGKRAQIAMKDNTRTGNEAAKIVLSAVDAYQDKTTTAEQIQRHEYSIDDDTKALLTALLHERRQGILDAETTDIQPTTTRNDDGTEVE